MLVTLITLQFYPEIQMHNQDLKNQRQITLPKDNPSLSIRPELPNQQIQTSLSQEWQRRSDGFAMPPGGQSQPQGAVENTAQLIQAKRKFGMSRINSPYNSRVGSSIYGSKLRSSHSNSGEEYLFHRDELRRSRVQNFDQLRSRGDDKMSYYNTGYQQEQLQIEEDRNRVGGLNCQYYEEPIKFKNYDHEDQYEHTDSEEQQQQKDVVKELQILPKNAQLSKPKQPSLRPKSQAKSTLKATLEQRLDEKFDKQKLQRMYKFPASYKEAMIHKIASKFGHTNTKIKRSKKEEDQMDLKIIQNINKPKNPKEQVQNEQKEFEKVPVCPCCQNHVSNIEIPILYSTEPDKVVKKHPKFLLQTGVSMYFMFIKAVILYLCLRLAVFDIANIVLSINGHYCSSVQHSNDTCAFTNISAYNLNTLQDTKALNILDYLNIALTLLSIVYFYFYKMKQARLLNWLDRNNKTQKDFSLLVEDIPLLVYSDDTKINEIDYNHQTKLKFQIQQKIRAWLKQKVLKDIGPDNFQQADPKKFQQYIEQHFYKFVFKRKVIAKQFQNEKKSNNPIKVMPSQNKIGLEKKPVQKTTKEVIDGVYKDTTEKQIVVPSITLCYDLTELQALNKIRDRLIQNFIKQTQNQTITSDDVRLKNQYIKEIPTQIFILNEQYIELCKNLAINPPPSFRLSHFTGKAIVSFQYKHYRDYLLRQYSENRGVIKLNDQLLKLSAINSPEDIYWHNMKVSDSERKTYIFYSSAVLFMMLVLSLASLVGLQYWQRHTEQPTIIKNFWDKIKSNLFSVAMAILTNVINFILSSSIQLLADMQRHKSKSDRLNSLMIKIIVTQTINTSFIYFILYLITPVNPLGKAGLVKNVFNLVLVSGFINVIWELISPIQNLKRLYNNWKYVGQENINMFQVQLNQLLQQPQFKFADSYANYIVFTFVVSFYGIIAPTATPVLIVIFIAQYWVDKYNLFKRYSCPVDFGAQLIKKIFIMFESSLVIFALGHFVWDLKMHKDQSIQFRVLNIANLVIASLFVGFQLFAPDWMKRKVFPFQQQQCDPFSYSFYLNDDAFKKTYFRQNPATSCLKQAKLAKANSKKNQGQERTLVKEAPDPQFIRPVDKILQKYLFLSGNRKLLKTYNELDQEYYSNIDKPDFDKANFQREFQKKYRDKTGAKKRHSLAALEGYGTAKNIDGTAKNIQGTNKNIEGTVKDILNAAAK